MEQDQAVYRMNTPRYQNKILVISPTRNYVYPLKLFIRSMWRVLEARPDVILVLLDNGSEEETCKYLKSLSHQQLQVHFFHENIGKPNGINQFIKEELSRSNLPSVLFSIDSDISFSPDSFNKLAEATLVIPKAGMMSMRYVNNTCNPEKHLFFPSKKIQILGKTYSVKTPFLCNVAGGCIALKGSLIEALDFVLYPKAEGKIRYPDDAFLYDLLKKKGYLSGYVNGTLATHWRSADKVEYDDSLPIETYLP